jgi:hypothetical protein
MAKSNKERQAEFKNKMYKKGFKQKIVWVDREGFNVNIKDEYGFGKRPKVEYNKFIKELKALMAPINEEVPTDVEEIYAELLSYAQGLRGKWDEINEMVKKMAE